MNFYHYCAICTSNKTVLVKEYSEPHVYSLIRCKQCGLIFQHPLPSEAFLKKFYHQLYSTKRGLSSTLNAYEQFHPEQEEARINTIEKYIRGGTLLDIGASSGFFLHQLSKHPNWKGYGVELSISAVKKAKDDFGLEITHGDIFNPHIKNNFFDVITMFSVLEHIPHVHETLDMVYKKLKPNGWLIFTVPNISSFEYAIYHLLKKDFPGFIFEHIYYFTPRAVDKLLRRHKFALRRMTSRHHSHISLPSPRPLVGLPIYTAKLAFEYTGIGGLLQIGNILSIYAQKKSDQKNS